MLVRERATPASNWAVAAASGQKKWLMKSVRETFSGTEKRAKLIRTRDDSAPPGIQQSRRKVLFSWVQFRESAC
jgi:hypothetical protein